MSEPPKQYRVGAYRETLWAARSIAAITAAALIGGFVAFLYLKGTHALTPTEKLAIALQEIRSNYDQSAISILAPLAEEGNAKAQYWLSDIYENGLGIKPDVAKALSLLEESASQGFTPAQRHLGELYLRGNEALQDFGKAQLWLRKAADSGDAQARRLIGQMFALGLGVAQDRVTAYAWYEDAALGGDGLAKHLRDDILTRMTPAEIAAGETSAKKIEADRTPAR